MIDINQLPVPAWGLRCSHCDTLIDGALEHRCPECGKAFSIMFALSHHHPIADLGLQCEECDYPLRGLMDDRCPECGKAFDLPAMVEENASFGVETPGGPGTPMDAHLKRREPQFTGNERPLPDFGLCCGQCGESLAGALSNNCPNCDVPFDLDKMMPKRNSINILDYVSKDLQQMAASILYDATIPYVVNNASLREMYGSSISSALRVPYEFRFDALFALTEAERPAADAMTEWTCPECKEQVPGSFGVCWNCGSERSA